MIWINIGIAGHRNYEPGSILDIKKIISLKLITLQYGKYNIRSNSIHPGFTDTPMTEDIHSIDEVRNERLAMTPMGRLGTPEDIAYGALYLASDESSWVTGSELVIDGGETCW